MKRQNKGKSESRSRQPKSSAVFLHSAARQSDARQLSPFDSFFGTHTHKGRKEGFDACMGCPLGGDEFSFCSILCVSWIRLRALTTSSKKCFELDFISSASTQPDTQSSSSFLTEGTLGEIKQN